MPITIRIAETMSGLHHFVDPALGDAKDRPMSFRIVWGGQASKTLNPWSPEFLVYDASGTISIDGFSSDPLPCVGSIKLDYLREHTVTYQLHFQRDGRPFRYVGIKSQIYLRQPWMLVKTHTTCYGTVFDDAGNIISKSVTHFDPSRLVSFLRSLSIRR